MIALALLALGCRQDALDSGPAVAPPALDAEAVMVHLEALYEARSSEAGAETRAVGSAGYGASADYVVAQLEAAGYTPQLWPFEVTSFQLLAPVVLESDGFSWVEGEDYQVMQFSGAGRVTAPVTAVDLALPPGEAENTSTSGCEAEDFQGFPAGGVALIQRGTCAFADKVAKAQAAGAAAVILFNEGQPGRTEVLGGTLDPDAPAAIPAVGASFALGEALAAALSEGEVTATVEVQAETEFAETWNVLAETAGGDPQRAVMAGAHLDSVGAGPGVNDNGSGSAALLALALEVAPRQEALTHRLRFAWWGAEEIGLVGSTRYVESLDEAALGQIAGYLNFDMIGSPNYVRYVYDEAGMPDGSRALEGILRDWFDLAGLEVALTPLGGRSDHAPFAAAGIPVGGLFTGAESLKSTEQASAYGGRAQEMLDPCYHQSCDTLDNVSRQALDEMAPAAAYGVWTAATTSDWIPAATARRAGRIDTRGRDYWGREPRR